jgi:hypothetical protein
VPHPTDKSDINSLPDPELNPLLNPLLAAHMGRWAEVYFTNPPERREQAVSELLRELENISPPAPPSLQTTPAESAERTTEIPESPNSFSISSSAISSNASPSSALFPAPSEAGLTCSVCAYNNAAGQRFCGMCGTPLQGFAEARLPRVAETAPVARTSWHESSAGDNSVEAVTEDVSEPPINSITADRSRDDRELNWLHPHRDLPDFAMESEPSSSYRVYVGAAVVVLLIVVGYMAWRGTEALSGTAASQPAASRTVPAAQPAPTQTISAQPNPAASVASTSVMPAAAPPASRAPQQSLPAASSPKEQAVDSRPAPRIVPVAATSSAAPAPDPSSAEDLATAEKYLNGSPGVPRDGEEAVRWLWRAEGKGNLAATMELADLFLRGDVLSKNCGQARVLLDAAAKKGSKTAAERLRNLQAFGCQ